MGTKTVELTERDIALLHLLSRCGIMKSSQAQQIYGDVKRYHLHRIEKLSKAGMIIRNYGVIRPSKKGLQAIGYKGEPVRLLKHQFKDRALAVELLLSFPDWDSTFGIELKRQGLLERGSRIVGTVSRDNLKYAFYFLSYKPRSKTVTSLQSELEDLRLWDITRVAIFCTTAKIINALDLEPPSNIEECYLLPYPAGVDSFRRIFTDDFVAFINQRFPGIKPCTRPFAHFEWQDNYITVMHTNDIVKRQALLEYLTYAQKRESRKCIIVCTPGQAKDIKTLFQEYDVELIIDERTDTKIQKPATPEKEADFISFSHYPIHP